jgi:hypothetical protein
MSVSVAATWKGLSRICRRSNPFSRARECVHENERYVKSAEKPLAVAVSRRAARGQAVTASPQGFSTDPQGSPQAGGKVVEMWTISRAQNAANVCRGGLQGRVSTRRFLLAPSTERE